MSPLTDWAIPQLEKLLPLDHESLLQIVTYTDTLSPTAAADNLRNLLGDSPQALEFITSFQTRRRAAPEPTSRSNGASPRNSSPSEVPRTARAKKTKQPFNKLPPPRQVEDQGILPGAYLKKAQDDYIPTSKTREPQLSNTLALQSKPEAIKTPQPTRLPPSASGPLISDALPQRTSSPSKPISKTKVNLTGGIPMRGASTTLTDLDSAIRQLEVTTNPSLGGGTSDTASRRCNCMAQRHALLAAAPNCLSCGKIICAKEGLGPCTFCSTPLLSPGDVQAMLRALREERGRERTEANNAGHRRAEVARVPRPFSNPTPSGSGNSTPSGVAELEANASLARAQAHRDRLLGFQAANAKRTRVHDEAADWDTPDAGVSAWASPVERALQLKRQQRVLREQAWAAAPEYEKRRVVVSLEIDSKGRGRSVRKTVSVDRPEAGLAEEDGGEDEWEDEAGHVDVNRGGEGNRATGTFSRNPLLGALIRPVYTPKEDTDKGKGKERETPAAASSKWRRVQDDADNEGVILDGGAYGAGLGNGGRTLGAEEMAVGS